MSLAIGAQLGPYRILEPLGRGGMGEVYKGTDSRLDRLVAIKVLPAEFSADPEWRERFRREARAISQLNHPNICTLFDVGEQHGPLFLVMEFLEGVTLADRLRKGPLGPDEAARIGLDVANGLVHAHQRGMVHRDLKSANIMIVAEGHAKLLDFGLAKQQIEAAPAATTRAGAPLTRPGVIAGTIGYMAPEVLEGAPADARADIWSFGIVVYEMLAGRMPFRGASSFSLASAILREPVEPLSKQTPPGLLTLVQGCLAKDPRQRYQTAAEVRAVLIGIQANTFQPSVAAPAPPPEKRRRARARSKRIRAIAVLPLANLTGDPNQEFFADGMTEALIADLGRIGALRVISRTSVMQYKTARKSLPEIASELGVDAVVEGSVLRSGAQVGIRAQLIRAANDEHLWAQSYQREGHDVLALQSEIAEAIAREIKILVTPEERARLTRVHAVDPAAHELYLKARYFEAKRSDEGFRKAFECYRDAVAISPGFALAYAGLAFGSAISQFYGVLPPGSGPDARSAALKATELDDSLADAYTALGLIRCLEWDWPGARDAYKRAVTLNPSAADAHHFYALYLLMVADLEDGLYEMRRAHSMDPLSVVTTTDMGWTCYFARQPDEARRHLARSIEMEPTFFEAHWALGRVAMQRGEPGEAIASFEQASTLTGGMPFIRASLGCALAQAGRREEATAILRELMALDGEAQPASDIALLHAHLGDIDEAFRWLDLAYDVRDSWLTLMKPDPRFDPLRADPRFAGLLRRMRLL